MAGSSILISNGSVPNLAMCGSLLWKLERQLSVWDAVVLRISKTPLYCHRSADSFTSKESTYPQNT